MDLTGFATGARDWTLGVGSAHEGMDVLLIGGSEPTMVTGYRDSGADQCIMSQLLADKLGIPYKASNETYGVIGNTECKHVGVARVCLQFERSPKLQVELRIADHEEYLFLLGQDLFHKDMGQLVIINQNQEH